MRGAGVYLDCNATTPVEPVVADAMAPWFGPEWGNPSSGHARGRRAARALSEARGRVATLLGAEPEEIVFTSGGTEANNTVVLGTGPPSPGAGRLVISAIEHPAVVEPARFRSQLGWRVDTLPVDAEGRVELTQARPIVERSAALVSVMLAHNETGVVQPVAQIAEWARAAGSLVHTDAAQAVGKIAVDVGSLGVDFMTVVGHKFGAPKGIGALYRRRQVALRPLLHGGGQERGMRGGTENVAFAVGLGMACELARTTLFEEATRQSRLRDRLVARLREGVNGLYVAGEKADRLPNTAYVCFPGWDGAALLGAAQEVEASTGSACHTGREGPPGVLAQMGVDPELGRGAIRFSLGRRTNEDEIERAATALLRVCETRR